MNDPGIWNKLSLRRAIESRKMELPEPRALPYRLEKIPFLIVGDDAFALKNYMTEETYDRRIQITRSSISWK